MLHYQLTFASFEALYVGRVQLFAEASELFFIRAVF